MGFKRGDPKMGGPNQTHPFRSGQAPIFILNDKTTLTRLSTGTKPSIPRTKILLHLKSALFSAPQREPLTLAPVGSPSDSTNQVRPVYLSLRLISCVWSTFVCTFWLV